jgi:hypothetical protein
MVCLRAGAGARRAFGDCSTAEITSWRPDVGASVSAGADATASRSRVRSLEAGAGLLHAAMPPTAAIANPDIQAMRRVVFTASSDGITGVKATPLIHPVAPYEPYTVNFVRSEQSFE